MGVGIEAPLEFCKDTACTSTRECLNACKPSFPNSFRISTINQFTTLLHQFGINCSRNRFPRMPINHKLKILRWKDWPKHHWFSLIFRWFLKKHIVRPCFSVLHILEKHYLHNLSGITALHNGRPNVLFYFWPYLLIDTCLFKHRSVKTFLCFTRPFERNSRVSVY